MFDFHSVNGEPGAALQDRAVSAGEYGTSGLLPVSEETPPLGALSDDELADSLLTVAGHINAATCALLDRVAEAESRELHLQHGCRSVADWLSVRLGLSLSVGYEYARVGRALRRFRRVHAAFSKGEISYCKVRAITRVMTEANEEALVYYARYGTGAQMEAVCRALRGARQAADPEAAQAVRRRRYFSYRFDDDGSVVGSFRLPPEEGATFIKAIEEARRTIEADGLRGKEDSSAERSESGPREDSSAERSESGPREESSAERSESGPREESSAERSESGPQEDSSAERSESGPPHVHVPSPYGLDDADDPVGACRADAAGVVAQFFLSHGECFDQGASKTSPRDSRGLLPALVVVIDGDESRIEGGPLVSRETARRLACDATVETAIRIGKSDSNASTFNTNLASSVINLGRKRRVVSARLRRILCERDKTCRFPGCGRERFTHAHHIRHWADGGRTDLDNLVRLCSFHHRIIHEGGFRVEKGPFGELLFYNHRNQLLADKCASLRGSVEELIASNENKGYAIGPDTVEPLGRGEPYDLGLTIDALMGFEPVEIRGW
jgi:hypothetical protein